jgi:hypothetical protein
LSRSAGAVSRHRNGACASHGRTQNRAYKLIVKLRQASKSLDRRPGFGKTGAEMSRLPLLLVLVIGLCACRPDGAFDATVKLEKIFPAPDVATNRVVLYRVVSPEEIAGKYGIASTHAKQAFIQSHVGTIYRIRLTPKDRQILSRNPPENALVGGTDDFFDRASPQSSR